MKCDIMWHFIWVFTVCLSTHLGVTSLQINVNLKNCLWSFSSALVHTKDVPTKSDNSTAFEKLEALFDMESNCEYLRQNDVYLQMFINTPALPRVALLKLKSGKT